MSNSCRFSFILGSSEGGKSHYYFFFPSSSFYNLEFALYYINIHISMSLFLFSFFLSVLLSILVLVIGLLMSYRRYKDREKSRPFECGFDPKRSARIPFSTRFFLLAVIFLVFDIEIAIILPAPLLSSFSMNYELITGFIPFIIILILGLLHEWREGSLNWKE